MPRHSNWQSKNLRKNTMRFVPIIRWKWVNVRHQWLWPPLIVIMDRTTHGADLFHVHNPSFPPRTVKNCRANSSKRNLKVKQMQRIQRKWRRSSNNNNNSKRLISSIIHTVKSDRIHAPDRVPGQYRILQTMTTEREHIKRLGIAPVLGHHQNTAARRNVHLDTPSRLRCRRRDTPKNGTPFGCVFFSIFNQTKCSCLSVTGRVRCVINPIITTMAIGMGIETGTEAIIGGIVVERNDIRDAAAAILIALWNIKTVFATGNDRDRWSFTKRHTNPHYSPILSFMYIDSLTRNGVYRESKYHVYECK